MPHESHALLDRTATDCAVCRRSVLPGEPLTPYLDPRGERHVAVCELCRARAQERGWQLAGDPIRRGGATRLRVELMPPTPRLEDPEAEAEPQLLAPQLAIIARAGDAMGHRSSEPPSESAGLLERLRRQDEELARLRRDLDPVRRAEEQRRLERQAAELRELRTALRDRDARIERLGYARHAETSAMRMSGHALDAFNQSAELERMARIARTLGEPVINVHDQGAGIPRRVLLTLSWDIAWYEYLVKLDLGAGRASVHQTRTGGDPSILPLERRRANARWSDSGLKLS